MTSTSAEPAKSRAGSATRAVARLVAALAVVLGLSSVLAAPAAAAGITGIYYIHNLGARLCLDAFYSGGGVNGNPVGLWECNRGITEQWRLVPRGTGAYPYQLKNMRNQNLCLDYEAASGGEPGWQFKLWSCNGSAAQNLLLNVTGLFQVESSKRGAFNTMVMDAYASGGGGNGNPVGIWPETGSLLQQWSLELAG